jgi:hypothetical protein
MAITICCYITTPRILRKRRKRSKLQKNVLEKTKSAKTDPSHKRAQEFMFEVRNLLI